VLHSVAEREFVDRIEALGTARANESTVLTSNVADKVVEIGFRDGSRVEKGELIVRLDDRSERAELAAARARLKERQQALKRARDLAEDRVVSEAEVDLTRAELASAEAEVEAMASALADRTIRAPFDGFVGLRNISLGALVSPGDAIVRLSDIDPIKADFTVPATRLSRLRAGAPLQARSSGLPGEVFRGRIESIDTEIDPVSRSVTARALLPNPDGRLKPGMLLEIEVQADRRNSLAVPEAALVPRGDRQFVFVADEGVASRREVTIGSREPGWVEITSGLERGEAAVARGLQAMSDGRKIVAITEELTHDSAIAAGER